jgi:hypothetical protein
VNVKTLERYIEARDLRREHLWRQFTKTGV